MRSIGGSFHLLQPVVAALILLVVCLVYALQSGSGTISEFSSDVLFSRAKYSGVPVHHSRWRQDAGIHVIDSHHIVRRDSYGRRGKRDVTSTDRRRRLQGVARDCGHACHLRLRSDDAVYIVHLHRWNQIPDSHNKSVPHFSNSNFAPMVLYLDSEEEVRGGMSRTDPDCIYRAHVKGVHQHSIVNLCDSEDGLYGMLALPSGIHTVEPIISGNGTEHDGASRHRQHLVRKFDPMHFKSFDHLNSTSVNETETTVATWQDQWEDVIERKARSRRAANSWDHYVEVLVVADTKMYEYHGRSLEDYVLTLFSTVASIYRHQSLRASINVVVVKLIVLKTENAGPRITQNAQQTLQDFCRWQQYYNDPDDSSVQHHDVAILLTRKDICRSQGKCDTLGLAELGTMCDMQKSCAIIEDNGLSAAFTIAHELGHVFSIPHDDERKCSTYMPVNKNNFHIMAPTLEYNTHPWSWSPCSAGMLERFLENNRGQTQCLFDQPVERRYYEDVFVRDEPGKKYDAHQQCKFVFGPASELCPYMPTCRRLWCATFYGSQMGCRTQHMPWADGTPCDESRSMFCHHGACVRLAPESLTKIDGQWGDWRSWGECSRTCGGGVQKGLRDCDSPKPRNGGKYCVGQRERYRSCNTQECPWDTQPYREVQCSEFNNKDIGIQGVASTNTHWVPKYANVAPNERCKLYCRLSGSAAFYLLRDKVVDGTPCDRNGDDICVAGACMPAGCDHQLHSTLRRDKCGVCGGDDSSCKVVKGTFNEQGTFGYNEVMKIPAGSANIDIRQKGYNNMKEDDNYLSLRAANGEFLLNGHFQVSLARQQIAFQDTVLEYSGSDAIIERINGTGPIRSDIYVHVLSVGSHPPDISYEYMTAAVPNAVIRPISSALYLWRVTDTWTECDRACRGQQSQKLMCLDMSTHRQSHDRNCQNVLKPKQATRMCNIDCSTRWITEDVSSCSAKCGSGQKRQRVSCVKMEGDRQTPASEHLCDRNSKPSDIASCYIDCSGRKWNYGEWTSCSETCGSNGKMHRKSYCVDDSNRRVDESLCGREQKEATERECNRIPCPRWVYGHWSECSRSCDGGVKMRHAQCLDAADRETHTSRCGPAQTQEHCNEHACTWWQFGVWSDCSAKCGDGVQYRDANCTDRHRSVLPEHRCLKMEKIITKPCHRESCPKYKLGEWSQCSVSCEDGWSSRRVSCVSGNGTEVDMSLCGTASDRPASHQTCNLGTCPFWRNTDWSACSVSCGIGHRERTTECIYREQSVDASFCGDTKMPETSQTCHLLPCTSWKPSHWSPCSVTCGSGIQTRSVSCTRGSEGTIVDEYFCDRNTRPRLKKTCEKDTCDGPRVLQKLQADVPPIRWATGPWTACSATCGNGTQRRLLKCRDHVRDLPDEYCNHLDKEVSTRNCRLRDCSYWKMAEWEECPATCGTHVQQSRNVTCVSAEDGGRTILKDVDCDVQKRPTSARNCRLEPCPKGEEHIGSWIIGDWSKCSASCGGGWRRRSVSCTSSSCDETRKPKMFDKCNEELCPPLTNNSWQISPWTHCSVSCGGGVQRRKIWCEDVLSGRKQDDIECSEIKPREQRDCEMPPCRSHYHNKTSSASMTSLSSSNSNTTSSASASSLPILPPVVSWQTSAWSACSAKCGRGTKRRVVECVNPSLNVTVASTECDQTKKPVEEVRCRTKHCPRWKTTTWSSCSVTCGRGIRRREVQCYRGRKNLVSDSECNPKTKLNSVANCFPVACPAYRWNVTPWSKCKDECARGQKQTRRVHCISTSGKRAAPRMCELARAPTSIRECDTSNCPYEWVPGDWQTCSKSCGEGVQTREVRCRRKINFNSTIPIIFMLEDEPAVPKEKCELFPKPNESQTCELNPCDSEFKWSFGPWGECSKNCGQGIRRRRVKCVANDGRRVERVKCTTKKPRRTQYCFERNCLPSTCQELKSQNVKAKDGNYTILLDGFTIEIYCHRMNSTIPKAYLNVNPRTNFAEVYGKKLIYPHTCPFNGDRNDSCHCSEDGDASAGLTRFNKVRIDLLNRKFHLADYTFAKREYGVHVPYGTAGDCYSMKDCPQGIFSIDLKSAGLKLVDDLNWEDQGHRTSSRIDRFYNNAKVIGHCGGFCGKCSPERYKGLIFEVNTKLLNHVKNGGHIDDELDDDGFSGDMD
ncbi:A disintegrin and metalloproteinase with thrombospondin motifs gon-1 [Caenorhabditis elegans]|uniref:A disintegrin and metalloproteinase with thrombospondin motifs gon-1 n=1 Tax=Caenorhabditis elegans TaxID=6239 RepID=GON1_CAEEL|nr:A disintegrin and metalloproteinase with thrombospondin motifs gon-1 [Caenorhabditis elegans]Q19791.3 RecName: Full=A disintegrin and metalloproteinase with thrombospondin motifs gon-1; Short=ADAMTS gon-1; AltName: Full=Abnormal gonad development protein 1; Flags: Precursor [Caenorhabditis elegans]CAA93287.2 A disintegrin and metalloproteinase with thrombospondin motifs gon-1 [Caenorhabditis elegans]|eukprot:NP_001255447.1 A disintegrin and metalloproteinase with thrombospondin motifs gon-1 [Caenorhabditis elegans]